ncbi:hypothetical protein CRUP_029284, partial [Coryphaenoides rupestris]
MADERRVFSTQGRTPCGKRDAKDTNTHSSSHHTAGCVRDLSNVRCVVPGKSLWVTLLTGGPGSGANPLPSTRGRCRGRSITVALAAQPTRCCASPTSRTLLRRPGALRGAAAEGGHFPRATACVEYMKKGLGVRAGAELLGRAQTGFLCLVVSVGNRRSRPEADVNERIVGGTFKRDSPGGSSSKPGTDTCGNGTLKHERSQTLPKQLPPHRRLCPRLSNVRSSGEVAQDAIRSLHQRAMRGRSITVALQPTDALLCLANLPHALSGRRFEELVRAYGNIERCFLVYSQLSGHSKGYGFVEYMKKDSASRARAELLGRAQTLHEEDASVQLTSDPGEACIGLRYTSPEPFVTLLTGAQAQDAIRSLHQRAMRGRSITVALQPTDALLCLANLPHALSGRRFEELVRAYGNIERCFLVYSQLSGHSKGYGFVEYMKKDSASRARAELLGRAQ